MSNPIQLNMFAPPPKVVHYAYPWEGVFDWHPEVGKLASMHAVILEGQGYCYGDTVRINSIDGEDVTCTVEHQMDANWWKNGTVYRCKKSDLWPVFS